MFALDEQNVSTSKDMQQREHSLRKDKKKDLCKLIIQ